MAAVLSAIALIVEPSRHQSSREQETYSRARNVLRYLRKSEARGALLYRTINSTKCCDSLYVKMIPAIFLVIFYVLVRYCKSLSFLFFCLIHSWPPSTYLVVALNVPLLQTADCSQPAETPYHANRSTGDIDAALRLGNGSYKIGGLFFSPPLFFSLTIFVVVENLTRTVSKNYCSFLAVILES